MRTSTYVASASAALLCASAASAANLIQNGGFDSNGGNGQVNFNTSISNWSVSALPNSYVFVFNSGTADVVGSTVGQYGEVNLWGPNNGSANGLPASSPAGGAFIASNPAFQNGPISQTITGLTKGQKYTLTFEWAGSQQFTFSGANTEGWQVSFGGQTLSTPIASLVSHGFSGWMPASFTFTADGTSDVLSFLALGGPTEAEPPFALLDGVSLVEVPEPTTWALLLTGVGLLGAVRRRRRQVVLATG